MGAQCPGVLLGAPDAIGKIASEATVQLDGIEIRDPRGEPSAEVDVSNVFVIGASAFPQNGGYNPTDTVGALTEKWRNRGHSLGFGVGIALGYATLGQIGFEQRLEYAAIGSVTNLASRLCDEAKANQIVVSRRVYGMVEHWVEGRPIDDLQLKGFNHPVLAVEILRWREEAADVAEAAAEAPRRRQQPS